MNLLARFTKLRTLPNIEAAPKYSNVFASGSIIITQAWVIINL